MGEGRWGGGETEVGAEHSQIRRNCADWSAGQTLPAADDHFSGLRPGEASDKARRGISRDRKATDQPARPAFVRGPSLRGLDRTIMTQGKKGFGDQISINESTCHLRF